MTAWLLVACTLLSGSCAFSARGPVTYGECAVACGELGVAAFYPGRQAMMFACTCKAPPVTKE